VDTDDRSPSPAGAFALWDGFGLVVKYVEVIPGSDPVMVRLISRNSVFETYERPVEDIHINGRIIGKWLWT
jgi:phage repressor protein C with HTH and peptisase S24 domain